MKVLFVRSYNLGDEPISTRQGESLQKVGVEVVFFNVVGKGASGYLSNLRALKNSIKLEQPDLIHAHYSFCGILSAITFSGVPVVVSLMGSDVLTGGKKMLLLLKFFSMIWKGVIVKSDEIYALLGIRNAVVIPNGVDPDVFCPGDKTDARKALGFDQGRQHLLFASDPARPEKNFALCEQALEKLKEKHKDIELHYLVGMDAESVVKHYNACDCVVLTSLHEGSPNVIKEAMACNRPIVATRVGDVAKNLGGVEAAFVSGFDANELAQKVDSALNFKESNGRQKLLELGLDSKSTVQRLMEVYKKAI